MPNFVTHFAADSFRVGDEVRILNPDMGWGTVTIVVPMNLLKVEWHNGKRGTIRTQDVFQRRRASKDQPQ